MKGALIHKWDVNQLFTDNVHGLVTFSREVYDTDGFFNPAYPTRLTIPAGISKVILKAQVVFAGNPTGLRQLVIKKNLPNDEGWGVGWYPGVPAQTMPANNRTTTDVQVFTAPIPVIAGDYFELEALQCSGGNLNILKSVGTWFSIEEWG